MEINYFRPKTTKEISLKVSLEQWAVKSICSIDAFKIKLESFLGNQDKKMVFGNKPSYFYDIEFNWYYLHLYHKNRNGQRTRLALTAALSGMDKLVPKPDLDILNE